MKHLQHLITREWSDPYKIRTASEANDRANRITRLEQKFIKTETIE